MTVNIISRPDVKKKNENKSFRKAGLLALLSKYGTLEEAKTKVETDINTATNLAEIKVELIEKLKDVVTAIYSLGKGETE